MPETTIRMRLKRGWTVDAALTTPLRTLTDSVDVQGIAVSLTQACAALGLTRQAIHQKAKRRGYTIEYEVNRRFKNQPELFQNLLNQLSLNSDKT